MLPKDITQASYTPTQELEHGLQVIMETQSWIADLNSNGDRIRQQGRLGPDQVSTYAFAMLDEIHELAKKLGWKPWKTQPDITPEYLEDLADEFADILAFQGYLILGLNAMGITPEMLAYAYRNKSIINKDTLSGAKLRQDGDGNGVYRAITENAV